MIATAHNITFLEVPRYGDPHHEANLVCHYVSELDDPALHSVKWYRGSNEIFRFMPGQQVSPLERIKLSKLTPSIMKLSELHIILK